MTLRDGGSNDTILRRDTLPFLLPKAAGFEALKLREDRLPLHQKPKGRNWRICSLGPWCLTLSYATCCPVESADSFRSSGCHSCRSAWVLTSARSRCTSKAPAHQSFVPSDAAQNLTCGACRRSKNGVRVVAAQQGTFSRGNRGAEEKILYGASRVIRHETKESAKTNRLVSWFHMDLCRYNGL
ncbi:uncharacterized protein M421DRAFT_171779 [Didymella exigua CBS 183.55]|uniref:Uncharacterized protein n=1 Tax=Didymella exigua CBS 183.55 TaxID=1150837 RepID=A0A6A5RK39_9PLEO|nr:uncharacterized protein M421DRAFT_171779 [Didymella exigua CBS 183.55]KAF1927630.1 hypothetical protein M421DRAFT_171779 [Didymella exigua CBS 183.55]